MWGHCDLLDMISFIKVDVTVFDFLAFLKIHGVYGLYPKYQSIIPSADSGIRSLRAFRDFFVEVKVSGLKPNWTVM